MIAEGPECVNEILLEEINTSLHPEGDLNNFLVPPHEEYYAELISRNEGIIPPDVQDKIRRTTFIIFGTGSTGGNIAVTLAEIGAENFVIADKDTLDLSNLNRQPGTYRELGKQKTDIVGYRIQEINPYAKIAKYTQQISPDDIQKILNNIPQNSIVFFEMDDRDSFIEAVASSQRKSIPLILIIDIGHAVHISYFNPNKKIFNGKLSITESQQMSLSQIMAKFIGISNIPIEYIDSVSKMLEHQLKHLPQVATAAKKSGAIAAETVIALLSGMSIRPFTLHNTYTKQLQLIQRLSQIKNRYSKLIKIPPKLKKNSQYGNNNTF